MTHEQAGGSGKWCEEFEHTLDEMTEAYNRLEALGQQQQNLMDAGAVEPMLGLLEQRTVFIDQLEQLAPRFESGVARWTQLSATLAEPTQQMLMRRLSAIEKAAESIAQRDEQTSAWLEQARTDIADEINGLGRQSAAANAYQGVSTTTPRPIFQDREG